VQAFLFLQYNFYMNHKIFPITIAVIEDDAVFRNSVLEVIGQDNSLRIIGTYANAHGFLDELPTLNASLYWVDINLPDGTGIELVREIKKLQPEALCLMCTLHNDDEHVFKALQAGANGYILKSTSAAKMLESIDELLAGGAPMSPYIATRVIRSFQKEKPSGLDELSTRENEILLSLSKGLLYKEIAALHFISKETVKKHIANIYKKLQVQNRTEAVLKYLNL
jgi:NarL family two-component system response regulator LiaR